METFEDRTRYYDLILTLIIKMAKLYKIDYNGLTISEAIIKDFGGKELTIQEVDEFSIIYLSGLINSLTEVIPEEDIEMKSMVDGLQKSIDNINLDIKQIDTIKADLIQKIDGFKEIINDKESALRKELLKNKKDVDGLQSDVNLITSKLSTFATKKDLFPIELKQTEMSSDLKILEDKIEKAKEEIKKIDIKKSKSEPLVRSGLSFGGQQESIQFKDEGSSLGTAGSVKEIDFVGDGVEATRTDNKITVTINGAPVAPEFITSTTPTNLYTMIDSSTLVPGMLYLINHQTDKYIAGTDIWHKGSVERILLLATSTNTLSREGWSVDNPAETITYNPTRTNEYLTSSADLCWEYSDIGAYYDYDNGNQGTVDAALEDTAVISFNLTTQQETYMANAINGDYSAYGSFYLEAYDPISEVSIYLDSNNLGDDWEYSGEVITILDGSNGYLSAGFDFMNIANYSGGYVSMNFPYPYNYSGSSPNELVLDGDYTFTFNTPQSDPTTSVNFSLSVYDDSTATTYTYDFEDYGVTWSYNPTTHQFTLLDHAINLSSLNPYSSVSIFFQEIIETHLGFIDSRTNHEYDFYVQDDYRGRLVRRYMPNASAFVPSVSNAVGTLKHYNSVVYRCVKINSDTTPLTANWVRMMPYDYVMTNYNYAGVQANTALYEDVAIGIAGNEVMFAGSSIKTTSPDGANVRFKGINTFDNTNLLVDAGGATFTTNSTYKSTIKTASGAIFYGTISNSNIGVSAGVFGAITSTNAVNIVGSAIYSLDACQINYIGNSYFKTALRYTNIMYMYSCVITSTNYVTANGNTFLNLSNMWFNCPIFNNNTIVEMYNCSYDGNFFNNSFFYSSYNNTITGSCSDNVVLGRFFGNTLYSFSYNKCLSLFIMNSLPSGAISNCLFGSVFQYNTGGGAFAMSYIVFNNIAQYNAFNGSATISTCVFNSKFNNNIIGNATLQQDVCNGEFSACTLNNGSNVSLNTFATMTYGIFNASAVVQNNNSTATTNNCTFNASFKNNNYVGFNGQTFGYTFENNTVTAQPSSTFTQTKSVTYTLWNPLSKSADGTNNPETITSTREVYGSLGFKTTSGASGITLDATHYRFIGTNTTTQVVNFPTTTGLTQREYEIIAKGSGALTLTAYSGQTINGASTFTLNAGEYIKLAVNGTNWEIAYYVQNLSTYTGFDSRYYTESEVDTFLGTKQDTLVSGTNIKTINGNSVLGSGNLVIPGSGNFADNELPSGLVNGSNQTFTLANTPTTGSEHLFQNGIRLKPTTDYTISGATITWGTAPTTGDILLADYRY